MTNPIHFLFYLVHFKGKLLTARKWLQSKTPRIMLMDMIKDRAVTLS